MQKSLASALALLALLPARAFADPTVPGAVTTPHPTVENLSIEWAITGDTDADGVVTVRFRPMGSTTWRDGLPLKRVPAGVTNEGFSWTNKHSGSLFGLQPGTTYEIELTLTDPDGGDTVQTVTASTRPIPAVPAGAIEIPVTPGDIQGALDALVPGDVLVLAPGTYASIEVFTSGTATQPIVVRASDAGGVIVEGDVRMDYQTNVWLLGLEVHGKVKFNGAEGIVVRNCHVITAPDGLGIQALAEGVNGAYICDNVVEGPTMLFDDTTVGADGNNVGEGIELTGSGNVICRNHVFGFRDCISTVEDTATLQVSIDIYGNELERCADDAIEADFSMGNVRVYRNRIKNAFDGISSQPGLGGPAYFIRNVMYNVIYTPFKLHRMSNGDVAFHNTVVKTGDALAVYAGVEWDHAWFRNNLFIGGTGGGIYGGYGNGTGLITDLSAAGPNCDFDYDGFGAIGIGGFTGNIGGVNYGSLAAMQAGTTEKHAVEVDLSVFAASVPFPASPFPEAATFPDYTLAPAGAAVDSGVVLPNVDDDFAGAAPDLGAYESGQPLPGYGPGSSVEGQGAGGPGGSGGNGTGGNGTGGSGANAGGGGSGGSGNDPGQNGGCSCSTTGSENGPAIGFLFLAGLIARRRPRREGKPC